MEEEVTIRINIKNELGEVIHTWVPPSDTFKFSEEGIRRDEYSGLVGVVWYRINGYYNANAQGQSISIKAYFEKERVAWQDATQDWLRINLCSTETSSQTLPIENGEGLVGFEVRWGAWSAKKYNTDYLWSDLINGRSSTVYLTEDGVATLQEGWTISADVLEDEIKLPIAGTVGYIT